MMRRSLVLALFAAFMALAANLEAGLALPTSASVSAEATIAVGGRQLLQEGEGGEQPPAEGDGSERPPVEGDGSEQPPVEGDESSPPIEETLPSPPPPTSEENTIWPSPWFGSSGPSGSSGSPPPAPAKPKTMSEYCMATYRYSRKVYVSNGRQLRNALKSARPGDMIFVKTGTYTGSFEISNKRGNVWKPITICGWNGAEINTKNNVGLLLHKTKFVNVVGLTVRNASKGIRLETAVRCTLDKVTVKNTGAEGIHIQYSSHYNTVKNSNISNTGRKIARVGEGIYLGSSSRNVRRDVCVGNKILNNRIIGSRAEPIDVKEYSRDGIISGNYLDGSRLCRCPDAVSLINVKGNGYRVENNVGRNAIEAAFTTNQVSRAGGQGRNNVFKGNRCLNVRRGKACVRKPGGGSRGNKFYA